MYRFGLEKQQWYNTYPTILLYFLFQSVIFQEERRACSNTQETSFQGITREMSLVCTTRMVCGPSCIDICTQIQCSVYAYSFRCAITYPGSFLWRESQRKLNSALARVLQRTLPILPCASVSNNRQYPHVVVFKVIWRFFAVCFKCLGIL